MQELDYQLTKEDYLDWIHWNVSRQNLKKTKIITGVIYAAFFLFYLGSSIAAKRDPVSLISTLFFVLVLGFFMFYIVSAKHQEKMIWKRSGLKKMEKTVGFPAIHLTVYDDHVIMEVPDQVHKEYSFTDITQLEETERLFLLGASDKTWQFVAKSAFESASQKDEFKALLEEKIADAKENPEKYRRVKETPAAAVSKETDEDGASSEHAFTPEEEPIVPVDTSNMGKIGKMAHIMAAMAAENAAPSAPEEEEGEGEEGDREV